MTSNNNDSATELLLLSAETGFFCKKKLSWNHYCFCLINYSHCPHPYINAKFKSVKLSHACMKLDHLHTILFWLCHSAISKAIKYWAQTNTDESEQCNPFSCLQPGQAVSIICGRSCTLSCNKWVLIYTLCSTRTSYTIACIHVKRSTLFQEFCYVKRCSLSLNKTDICIVVLRRAGCIHSP